MSATAVNFDDLDLVCPVGDDDKLASIWLRLSDVTYREMKGHQALKRVTETFTISKCCKSTIDFLAAYDMRVHFPFRGNTVGGSHLSAITLINYLQKLASNQWSLSTSRVQ